MIKISSVIFVWTIHLGQLFLLTGLVPCIVHPPPPPPPKKKLLKFKQFYNTLHFTTTKDFSAVRLQMFFSLSLIEIDYYELTAVSN